MTLVRTATRNRWRSRTPLGSVPRPAGRPRRPLPSPSQTRSESASGCSLTGVSSRIAKTRVVVPPHIRADGTRVGGYTYERKGKKLTRSRARSNRVRVMSMQDALKAEGDDIKIPPRGKDEPDFVYQARVLKALPEQDKHDIIAMIRERTDVCPPIHDAAVQWRAERGLPEPKADWDNVTADLSKAKKITAALETTDRDPNNSRYRAAYDDFKLQTDEMWDLLTNKLGVQVEVWDERTEGRDDPYETAEAQALDLIQNHHIYVNRGEFFIGNDPLSPTGTKHPFMTGPEYFRFRAVHDAFGHAGVGGGFDRHGEYEAWMHHSSMYTGEGQKAMSTEYHGVNSWLWDKGYPLPEEHWGVLLPDDLIKTPFDEHGNVVRKDARRDRLVAIINQAGLTHEAATMLDNDYEHTHHHHVLGLLPSSRVSKAGKLRDGDGDGMVLDGKPGQRPATPAEKARGRAARAAKKARGGSKGGGRASVRPATYKGKAGWKLTGKDADGRTVSSFYDNEDTARRDAAKLKGTKPGSRFKADFGAPKKADPKKFMEADRKNAPLGSKENPIQVKSAKKALALIAEGKHVEMDKDTVAVMLDKLSAIGKEAFEKGEDTPDFDLCRVHVPDTNIFCEDNKGIIRSKMPQLSGKKLKPGSYADKKLKRQQAAAVAAGTKVPDEVDLAEEFIASLTQKGVRVTDEKVDANKLKATQSELKGGQIGGMMAASTIKGGKLDLSKPIFVSSDGFILDGHHRWASLAALEFTEGENLQMNIRRIHMPVQELVDVTNTYTREMGVLPKAAGGKTDVKKWDPECIGCVEKKAGRGPNPKSSAKEIVGSHGHRSHGKSILWPALYEHLRKKGHSKAKAAAISNGQWNKKHGKGAKNAMSTRVTKLSPKEMAQRKKAALASALKRRKGGNSRETPKAKKRRDMDAAARTARAITSGRRAARSPFIGGAYPPPNGVAKRALTPAEIKQRQMAAYKSALARSMKAKEIDRRRKKGRRKKGQSGSVPALRTRSSNPYVKNARKAFKHTAEHMAAEASGFGMMANLVREENQPWAYHPKAVNAARVRKDDEPISGEISKLDDDKQLVYGWMYVTHDTNGEIVVDKSGDFVDTIDELDDAVVDFVLHSRTGGVDHSRDDEDSPVQASRLVESIVFSPEKIEALGLPEGAVPNGWWAGWKVDDPEVWADVKSGKYKSFSVHGSGVREPYAAEIVVKDDELEKRKPVFMAASDNSVRRPGRRQLSPAELAQRKAAAVSSARRRQKRNPKPGKKSYKRSQRTGGNYAGITPTSSQSSRIDAVNRRNAVKERIVRGTHTPEDIDLLYQRRKRVERNVVGKKEAPQSAAVQAATYVGRQVRTAAQSGTISSAQRQQRIDAARASAAARKGTGTKDKNPQTPETKAAERKRKMLTAKPGTKENKAALTSMRTAIDTGEPLDIPAKDIGEMLQAAADQGFTVKKSDDGIYSIRTKTGVLKVRPKSDKKTTKKKEGA